MISRFNATIGLIAVAIALVAFLLGPYFTPFFIGILLILAAMDGKL